MEQPYPNEQIPTKRLKSELLKRHMEPMDLPFAILVVLIACIGLIMMFSASFASASHYKHDPAYFLLRQGPYVVLGLIVMYVTSRFNYQYFRALSVPAMLVALVLLALVPFIGSGDSHGARRWIYIAGISVQPSEIAKIAIILLFSAMISKNNQKMKTFKYGIAPFAGILIVVLALLLVQPHLSAMVLVCALSAVMLFTGGVQLRYFAVLISVVVPAAVLVLKFKVLEKVLPYAQARIDLWKDPWLDPLDKGYQAIQSLLAIGSGGLFGVGLGESRQKYLYLPEQHNDFVFAIVCEELGMFGACIVLALFMILILRGYWIALHARDRFGSLLVVGVTTLLAIHIFFNVAVVTSLVPVTGISMPFFSYGGSSLLILMAEMGIVLSVSRQLAVGESV